MFSFFKQKSPQEQVREWQRQLRTEGRNLDNRARELQRAEKATRKAVKDAVKRNDLQSAKILAREIVRSNQAVAKMYQQKAQLNSISMHLSENLATVRVVGHLQKSSEVMKLVNDLAKLPEMSITMREMSKEMMKAGVMEEIINEALDDVLDADADIEAETDQAVEEVMGEIIGEIKTQMPTAARKLPVAPVAVQPVEEPVDDEEEGAEMSALRARLEAVRS